MSIRHGLVVQPLPERGQDRRPGLQSITVGAELVAVEKPSDIHLDRHRCEQLLQDFHDMDILEEIKTFPLLT